MTFENIKEKIKSEIRYKFQLRYNYDESIYGLLMISSLGEKLNGKFHERGETRWDQLINFKDEIVTDLCNVVNNWDIRNYKELINLFPKQFPSYIKNNNCVLDINEHGLWEFFEKEY